MLDVFPCNPVVRDSLGLHAPDAKVVKRMSVEPRPRMDKIEIDEAAASRQRLMDAAKQFLFKRVVQVMELIGDNYLSP